MTLNMISTLRRRVAENGKAEISLEEYNQLQAEWITRAGIEAMRALEAPNPACPHIVTAGDGTSHCRLAASSHVLAPVDEYRMKLEGEAFRASNAIKPHATNARAEVTEASAPLAPKGEPVIGQLYLVSNPAAPEWRAFSVKLKTPEKSLDRVIEYFRTESEALQFIESCRPKDEGSDAARIAKLEIAISCAITLLNAAPSLGIGGMNIVRQLQAALKQSGGRE